MFYSIYNQIASSHMAWATHATLLKLERAGQQNDVSLQGTIIYQHLFNIC